MNKKLKKKNAFYAGVISIILCLSMFVSTTMAWFTDTVAIEGNRIEAGDVDVELHMYNEKTGKYEDISNKRGDVFGESNGQQWEPCKTEIIFLKTVNSGNMSLAYTLLLDGTVKATDEEWEAKKASVENPNEETLAALQDELAEELRQKFSSQPGLEYAIIPNMDYAGYQAMMKQAEEDDRNLSVWEILEEQIGEENVGSVIVNELTYVPYGEMKNTQKEEYMVLAVRMSPYAGNDFQGRKVNLNMSLTAKQLSHEFDSHGNKYDENAIFAGEPEEVNLLVNGDAENGTTGWSRAADVSVFNKTIFASSYDSGRRIPRPDDDENNTQYFKLYASSGGMVTIAQNINIVGGKTYTLSAQYYLSQGNTEKQDKLVTYVAFYDAEGKNLSATTKRYNAAYREWCSMSRQYKAPANAVKMTVYFRAERAAGIVYLDNLSVRGIAPEVVETVQTKKYPYYEGIEGATNLVVNPNFEELITEKSSADYGYPFGWTPYKKASNPTAVKVTNEYDDTVTIDETFEGEHSVLLSGSGNPYVYQAFYLEPNTTYQFSTWARALGSGNNSKGGRIKFEFYENDKFANGLTIMTDRSGHSEYFSYRDWFRYSYQFTTPGGCDRTTVYLRTGSIPMAYDNVELIQIGPTQALDVRTNEIFYYEEWGNAQVTATATYEVDANNYVTFYLMDGEKVLDKSEPISLNGKVSQYQLQEGVATWEFDISLMKDYMKEYTLKAVMCDAEGNPVDSGNTKVLATTHTVEKEVYRSCRPKAMNVDENGVPTGTYTVTKPDGTIDREFIPNIGYHTFKRLGELGQFGVNVVQNNKCTTPEQAVETITEYWEKYGLYSYVYLYSGFNPAGSDRNKEKTMAIVEAVKDLPGTFGYMISDEPDHLQCNEEAMKESYRVIRSIDDKHPVYSCIVTEYEWGELYTDTFANDPYFGHAGYPTLAEPEHDDSEFDAVTYIYNLVQEAAKELNDEGENKLFNSVLQAFTYRNATPSYNQMRTQIYQTFFAGAHGYGFFAFDNEIILEDGSTVHMMDHPMMAAAKEVVDSGEQRILNDYFIKGRGELFMEERAEEADGTILASKNHEYKEDETDFSVGKLLGWDHGDVNCRYIIWKEADAKGRLTGNLYAMLIDGNAKADHISIPLDNGTEAIGEFTATVIGRLENGVKIPSFTGNGTLEFDLDNQQSVLIKITPKK